MNVKRLLVSTTASFLLLSNVVNPIFADSSLLNFESPTYLLGNIHNQDGWNKTGGYDVEVVANTFGFGAFGDQTLRVSNGFASGSFGDQTFSKSLVNEAGETSAVNDGLSGGIRQSRFEAQFDLATVMSVMQPGLSVSVSPDRGDGARMSYLRFVDNTSGVDVFFDDYQDISPLGAIIGDANGCGVEDNFIETNIASLNRSTPHTIKLIIDFVDGTRNDIVNVYVDGVLKHTGTSWEDYFRYCEGNPTRPVDSLLIRAGGTSVPANLGNGYLFDNLNLKSLTLMSPSNKDECKNNGWKNFNNPIFKNQGDCVSYVQSNSKATGNKTK